jgi:hypothetical protein
MIRMTAELQAVMDQAFAHIRDEFPSLSNAHVAILLAMCDALVDGELKIKDCPDIGFSRWIGMTAFKGIAQCIIEQNQEANQ